jgi:hypothetical protein
MPKAPLLLVQSDHRYEPQQFRGYRYPGQAKSIVCCLYRPQTTTVHRTEWSVALFFRGHIDLSGNRLIFAVDIVLQPRFRNITNPGNPCQWNLFEQEFINQVFRGLRDQFLLRCLNKLSPTGFAFVILVPVVDETIFDNIFRCAAWATWHWKSEAKDV